MGILDGLLGGDYGASQYRGDQQNQLTGLGTLGQTYGGLATDATNQYNQYQPQANQALNNYASYLKTDPYTSQYGAAAQQQAMGHTTAAFLSAQSHLKAASAAAGGYGGGVSSNYGGGLASLAGSEASAVGGAANQVAQQRIASQGQRLGLLDNLYSSAANQAYGRETSAMGAQGGLYNELAGQYGNLATAAQQRVDSRDNAFYGGLGSLATLGAEGAFGGHGLFGGLNEDPSSIYPNGAGIYYPRTSQGGGSVLG